MDKIFNEDCLETLKRLDDNSVDLIITSPPYNKGYWSRNRRMSNNTFNTKSRRIDYGVFDDTMTPADYEKWQRAVIQECLRVLKPTGSMFYNHIPIQRDLNEINPTFIYDYPLKQTIIWDKQGTPKIDKSYFYPIIEYIYWLKKDKDSRPYFDRHNAYFQSSIWRIAPDKNNGHPAPFPIELPENIILSCSKEGDVVYDPFMGSGTVAIAAVKHNRHYLGSELNEEYVKEAEERLRRLKNDIS